MLKNNTAYKYEMPNKVPFVITICFDNIVVSLQSGAVQTKYNIYCIQPYKSDTTIEKFSLKTMSDDVNI